MITPYDAIIKAANRIQRDPGCYSFWENGKPARSGGIGCLLGWIGYYLQVPYDKDGAYPHKVAHVLGHRDMGTALQAIVPIHDGYHDSKPLVIALKKYAEKKHAPKPKKAVKKAVKRG